MPCRVDDHVISDNADLRGVMVMRRRLGAAPGPAHSIAQVRYMGSTSPRARAKGVDGAVSFVAVSVMGLASGDRAN
jgi:hypothetical protein